METVIGTVARKSEMQHGVVWLQVDTPAGPRVVRVEADPLTQHVHDSVCESYPVVIAGQPVEEPGPDGNPRVVLVADHVGIDVRYGNVMRMDKPARPVYLTAELDVTDTPRPGVQSIKIA